MNSYKKKYIVCTSINPMTEALKKFDVMEDWTLIVVADKKMEEDSYKNMRGIFLDCDTQEKLYPELSKLLGWNTVDRRNLGFLYAYQKGADIVAMVDDDNIPLDNWGKNLHINKEVEVKYYKTSSLAFDPLSIIKDHHLWHRGFPVELLEKRYFGIWDRKKITPLVQADLWNNDPDVDAFCRMRYNPIIKFDSVKPYSSNKISPFNMQNTFVSRETLKYIISIPNTGRMCDIWGAYYFQSYYADSVVYCPASVNHVQERSRCSIVNDLKEELLGYKYSFKLIEELYIDPESIHKYLDESSSRFIKLYQSYFEEED